MGGAYTTASPLGEGETWMPTHGPPWTGVPARCQRCPHCVWRCWAWGTAAMGPHGHPGAFLQPRDFGADLGANFGAEPCWLAAWARSSSLQGTGGTGGWHRTRGVPPRCHHPMGSSSLRASSLFFFLAFHLPLNLSALLAHMFAWRWRGLFFSPAL